MQNDFQTSLDIQDDMLTPFIPAILQDLWSLGGNPDIIQHLIHQYIPLSTDSQILDLGCGKGADNHCSGAKPFPDTTSASILWRSLSTKGAGIIREHHLETAVRLRQEDLLTTLDTATAYDVVIYGHDSDVLGSPLESLRCLQRLIRRNGFLLYETAYHDGRYEGEDYWLRRNSPP